MIHEFKKPIPCITPLGDAYMLYVTPSGFLENDECTCVLLNGGEIKHFDITTVKIWHNATFGIIKNKANELKESQKIKKGSKSNNRRKTSR